MTRGSPKTS